MDTCVRKTHLLEITLLLAMATSAAAQTMTDPPRTPWDVPDLNGVWHIGIATPLERPEGFAEKIHFSEAEAAAYLDGSYARRDQVISFLDGGEEKFVGTELWFPADLPLTEDRRTALIYEPANGKIPPLTEAAKLRQAAARTRDTNPPEGPEDRPAHGALPYRLSY